MSDLAWPRWVIDQPLLDGYGMEMLPAVASMEVEAGPPIQWPDADSDYRVVTVKFFCIDEATRLAFDRWYHDVILNGSLPFDVQLKDGRAENWWTAMMLDVWEAQWGAPGYVWLAAKLLLIGEPSATRDPGAFSITFDAAITMRAIGDTTLNLGVTFDGQVQMRAAPSLNSGEAFGVTFDGRVELMAVGTATVASARSLEDGDDRETEDGITRAID
jgi:hypothetical protein